MDRLRFRYILSLLCNAAVIALTWWSVSRFFVSAGEGNMQVSGASCFRYFTVLSNILAAAAGVVLLPFCVKSAAVGRDALPHWALLIKLAGTLAVAVTLLVVLVFLGPLMGYAAMFAGANLYLHLLCPLLALLSFCLLEGGGGLGRWEALWGALPVFLYGSVYLVMVVIIGRDAGGWEDFYFFNMHGLWYISYPAMITGACALAQLLRRMREARMQREK